LVQRARAGDHVQMSLTERRTNRSSHTSIALARWLDAMAAKHELSGMVLGDNDGLLVAHGVMDVDRAEAVAAVACLDLPRGVDESEMKVLSFEHEGAALVLAGLGNASSIMLENARIGVSRILSERIAA
jgi:hypothetical protein